MPGPSDEIRQQSATVAAFEQLQNSKVQDAMLTLMKKAEMVTTDACLARGIVAAWAERTCPEISREAVKVGIEVQGSGGPGYQLTLAQEAFLFLIQDASADGSRSRANLERVLSQMGVHTHSCNWMIDLRGEVGAEQLVKPYVNVKILTEESAQFLASLGHAGDSHISDSPLMTLSPGHSRGSLSMK